MRASSARHDRRQRRELTRRIRVDRSHRLDRLEGRQHAPPPMQVRHADAGQRQHLALLVLMKVGNQPRFAPHPHPIALPERAALEPLLFISSSKNSPSCLLVRTRTFRDLLRSENRKIPRDLTHAIRIAADDQRGNGHAGRESVTEDGRSFAFWARSTILDRRSSVRRSGSGSRAGSVRDASACVVLRMRSGEVGLGAART